MADFVVLTKSDVTTISGQDSHAVTFRPVQAGKIFVRSTPAHPPKTSASGYLGRVVLNRPGKPDPLASYKARIGHTALELSYSVMDTDLDPKGDWTCWVYNDTEANLSFDTEIFYPSGTPPEHKIATFDIGLLNLLFAEAIAAAQLAVHIQSSPSEDDKESRISWSPAVAASLPGDMKGQTDHVFSVPDYRWDSDLLLGTATWAVFRLLNFDSDPNAPVQTWVVSSDGVPSLEVRMALNADAAKVVAIDSDIDLDRLDVEFDVHAPRIDATIDFYGTVANVTVDMSGTATVAGVAIASLGDYFKDKLQSKVASWLGELDPTLVRQYVDAFFVNLMRLGPHAKVDSYQSDDKTLTVRYTVPGSIQAVSTVGIRS